MDLQEKGRDSIVEKPRYKARLMATGFTHQERIYYNEIFFLVMKHSFIRVLSASVAKLDLELGQMDVKAALFFMEN